MGEKTVSVTSFKDLLEVFENRKLCPMLMFRGVPREDYELVPRVGRGWREDAKKLLTLERGILSQFKERARCFLDYSALPQTEWEWLFLAQHYGVPTRLLDWTKNPLVAAFFACRQQGAKAAAIYACTGVQSLPPDGCPSPGCPSPFDIESVLHVDAPHTIRRLVAQDGIFSVHGNPTAAWNLQNVWYYRMLKIVVHPEARDEIMSRLHKYGVSYASLFPDLEGVGKYLTYLCEDGKHQIESRIREERVKSTQENKAAMRRNEEGSA